MATAEAEVIIRSSGIQVAAAVQGKPMCIQLHIIMCLPVYIHIYIYTVCVFNG